MYLADEYTEYKRQIQIFFEKLMFNMQNEETTWSWHNFFPLLIDFHSHSKKLKMSSNLIFDFVISYSKINKLILLSKSMKNISSSNWAYFTIRLESTLIWASSVSSSTCHTINGWHCQHDGCFEANDDVCFLSSVMVYAKGNVSQQKTSRWIGENSRIVYL